LPIIAAVKTVSGTMTLNQLRIFDIVAKHLNITLAAHEMRISQPSISKQLKALQDGYGVKLYTRGVQGIKLTDEGRQFLDAVRPILCQIDDLEKTIKDRRGKTLSSLRIAAGESPSVSLVPLLLKSFKQSHPAVQLFLRTNDALTIEQLVVTNAVELAISTTAPVDARVVSEQFFAAEVAAVVAAGSRLSRPRTVTLKELSVIPVITKVGRRICNQIEQQLDLKLNIVLECESAEAVKAAVKAGIGMGFQYRDAVESDLRNGHLRNISIPMLKKLRVNWYILSKRNNSLSGNAKDFLALLHGSVNYLQERFPAHIAQKESSASLRIKAG
jgi:LysR family transcriptional regulator, low CO2-responsive transcriptional regulator